MVLGPHSMYPNSTHVTQEVRDARKTRRQFFFFSCFFFLCCCSLLCFRIITYISTLITWYLFVMASPSSPSVVSLNEVAQKIEELFNNSALSFQELDKELQRAMQEYLFFFKKK